MDGVFLPIVAKLLISDIELLMSVRSRLRALAFISAVDDVMWCRRCEDEATRDVVVLDDVCLLLVLELLFTTFIVRAVFGVKKCLEQ